MDWNNPTITRNYNTQVLQDLKGRDESLAVWFEGVSDTNIPSGTKRWNQTNSRFEKWNGSSWVQLWPALDAHLVSTANPHGTTAAQVGAPDLTTYNAHVTNTSNPHSVTAAQVGAPTTATFNAHALSTSNPHNTTAAQVGALATANNLSELSGTQTTARSNIGAASAATLSSHTSNTSNPHNVTRGQIGAAASGANSDISSMTGCTSFRSSGTITIGSTAALNSLILAVPSGNNVVLDDNNNMYPTTPGGRNLGTGSNWFNGVTATFHEAPSSEHLVLSAAGSKEVRIKNNGTHYWTFGSFGIFTPTQNGTLDIGINGTNAINNLFFKGQLRNNGTPQTWSFFTFTDTNALNPAAAGSSYSQSVMQATMNAVNSIAKRLENLGLFN